MSNVGWLVTQKFVILVPDPIFFAPWSVLYGCTANFVTVVLHQDTLFQLRIARTMAFTRINCNTTTVVVLTATAASPLSLRVCKCFSSQPSSQGDHGGYSPRCLSTPSSSSVSRVKTHITKLPFQDGQPRTGKSDVYQQATAGLILLARRGNLDFLASMWCCYFCPMPYHKSIGTATSAMRWTA